MFFNDISKVIDSFFLPTCPSTLSTDYDSLIYPKLFEIFTYLSKINFYHLWFFFDTMNIESRLLKGNWTFRSLIVRNLRDDWKTNLNVQSLCLVWKKKKNTFGITYDISQNPFTCIQRQHKVNTTKICLITAIISAAYLLCSVRHPSIHAETTSLSHELLRTEDVRSI